MKKLLTIIGVCAVIAVSFCVSVTHKRKLIEEELIVRDECGSTLRTTGWAIGCYIKDHGGRLPPDFSAISNYIGSAALYICPWHSKEPGAWTDIEEWMDYVYVPWPSVTGVYTNYPLMYDRRVSNHGDKGIMVLLVEQAVNPYCPENPESFHGQIFWDEGCEWLRQFIKEHPEVSILVPVGMKQGNE